MGWEEKMFEQLKEATEEMDVDRCEEIICMWEEELVKV